jgi:phage terminase large subunit-like protein
MTLSREETIQLLKIEAELERRSRQRKLYGYFPDEGPYRRDLYQKHLEFFRHGKTAGERIFLAANRVGKALKHGTKVATPAGWTVIEDLRIGDVVIAGDGSPTKVVGVYPQGEVELFDISFDGVHAISSCAEHRWLFQHPRARYPYRQSHGKREPNPFYREWMIGDTKALAAFGAIPRTRAVIPITKPFLIGDSAPLPLDPYVLGVMLGDGGLTGKSMKLSSADEEILAAVRAHFNVVHYDAFDYGVNKSVAVFRELGLQGCDSSAKFIPKQYLYADEVTRLAVLQGLMDTDGSISMPNRCMEYSTCSDALADGFEWLAASLGMKTVRNRRHTKAQNGNGKPSWRIALRANRLCPFRLARKATRWRPAKETDNYIVHSVKPSGRGLATCIEVDHASHTYVIEHGIVTHNTESGGGYELACHLTGEYPHWWEGRRFDRPIKAWAAGDTSKTVKEILQNKLLGDIADRGTGVIPGALLGKLSPWVGVPDGVGEAWVKHVPTGRWSRLEFKSYDQGRISFQGTEIDAILLDEESPLDIVDECRLRTTATGNFKGGILMSTFTPLNGVTATIQSSESAAGKLFGRGASDNKGQVLAHIKAIESYLATGTALPANIIFLIEGEEEIGSPNLAPFLQQHAALLKADYVVVSDSAMWGDGIPAVTYGTRGVIAFEVRVDVPDGPVTPALTARVAERFHDAHRGLYGYDFRTDAREKVYPMVPSGLSNDQIVTDPAHGEGGH